MKYCKQVNADNSACLSTREEHDEYRDIMNHEFSEFTQHEHRPMTPAEQEISDDLADALS